MWAELPVGVQGGQGLHVHLLLTHNFDPAALATLSVGKLGQGVPATGSHPEVSNHSLLILVLVLAWLGLGPLMEALPKELVAAPGPSLPHLIFVLSGEGRGTQALSSELGKCTVE